jgi:hypothetical protein
LEASQASRQGGFATVLCVSQRLIGEYLQAIFAGIAPQTFHVPSPVTVGGQGITIDGEFRLLAPTITLDTRADDRIGVVIRADGSVSLSSSAAAPMTTEIRFRTAALVGLSITHFNGRYFVGLDMPNLTIEDTALEAGSPTGGLHSLYAAALRSQPVRNALTAAARSLPPAMVSLLPAGIPDTYHIAPAAMPCGASVFDAVLFEASVPITRIVARPVAGALAVGIDFAGSSGTLAHLPNLFAAPSPTVLRTTHNLDTDQFEEWNAPVEVSTKNCSIAVSLSPGAATRMVAEILSPAISGSFLDCHVALRAVGIELGQYQEDPRLRPGWLPGAQLYVGATYYDAPGRDPQTSRLTPGGLSADVDLHATLALHRKSDYSSIRTDGNRSRWVMTAHHVDVDLPWWISAGAVLATVSTPILSLMPLAAVPAVLFSLTSITENLESQLAGNAQAGINGAMTDLELSSAAGRTRLPGLSEPIWMVSTDVMTMNDQGLEMFASMTPRRVSRSVATPRWWSPSWASGRSTEP